MVNNSAVFMEKGGFELDGGTMNIIYLQCDARFNKWLLEKIDGKYVIQYTIEKCMKIGREEKCTIVAGIYDCAENNELVNVLSAQNIKVKISNEEDVNKRFLDIVVREDADYVIRVGGDQCLIDPDKITNIVESMKRNTLDFFYEEYINPVLPDVVSTGCLKRWEKELKGKDRYFKVLDKQENIRRYRLQYPVLILYNFRANSNESFRICKIIINNNLDIYELSRQLLLKLVNSDYLVKTGLLGSWIIPSEIGDFFYDENKEINPWWGRSVIDFVKKYLDNSLSVFEWGAGNSTLFWSAHVKEVVSIEHNKQWYERMLKIVPENVAIKYCELEYGGGYCAAILNEKKKFDIILIDGRDRVRCAQNAVLRLKERGIIIWDNSERESYKKGYEFLKEQGFKQFEISSLIYGLPGIEDFTSIFYKEDNLLGL